MYFTYTILLTLLTASHLAAGLPTTDTGVAVPQPQVCCYYGAKCSKKRDALPMALRYYDADTYVAEGAVNIFRRSDEVSAASPAPSVCCCGAADITACRSYCGL